MMNQFFQYKNLLFFLLLSSILALFFAYVSQYFFDLQPCILCLYQRKPFFAVIILTTIALFWKKDKKWQKLLLAIGVLLILTNAFMALYHVGVEKKIFAGPSTCSNVAAIPDNLEELKQALEKSKTVRCDQPAFVFLGLSMAGWNVIYCLFLVIFSLIFLRTCP